MTRPTSKLSTLNAGVRLRLALLPLVPVRRVSVAPDRLGEESERRERILRGIIGPLQLVLGVRR